MLDIFSKVAIFLTLVSTSMTSGAVELTVSAASSLTDAFKEIAASFEKDHPDTKILLNVSASGVLLQQLEKGAPVDVIALADLETMEKAENQGLVKRGVRKIFASNSLVVITAKNSKLALKFLEDLKNPAFARIAIGNPDSVPAGRYAKTALIAAGSWDMMVPKLIQTQNVRQALVYVARGEVDAGIVYATDAIYLNDKVTIALDLKDQQNLQVNYPIAPSAKSKLVDESRRFVDFVTSKSGQDILNKYGFKKP